MTRIALLGAGRMGQVHAAAIAEAGGRLAVIYDSVSQAAEAVAARTGAKVASTAAGAIDGLMAAYLAEAATASRKRGKTIHLTGPDQEFADA